MPIKSAVDEQGTIEVIGVAQVLNKSKYAKGKTNLTRFFRDGPKCMGNPDRETKDN